MILDALGILCDAQAFTVTGGLSTNTFDCGNVTPKRQIGDGRPVGVFIAVDVAADFTTGDETYRFDLVQSAADTLTTATVIASEAYIATGALVSTLLVAGYTMFLPIPMGMPIQRYIGLSVVMANTTPTITISAWVTPAFSVGVKPQTYAKAYSIL